MTRPHMQWVMIDARKRPKLWGGVLVEPSPLFWKNRDTPEYFYHNEMLARTPLAEKARILAQMGKLKLEKQDATTTPRPVQGACPPALPNSGHSS